MCDGDLDFAILAKGENDKKTTQMRSRKDFPGHQILYLNKYFEMQNDWTFSDLSRFNSKRMVRGLMRVGANFEVKQVIKEVSVHISTDVKAQISYKEVQLMKT